MYLSHETALAYWRYHFPPDSVLDSAVLKRRAPGSPPRKVDVLASVPEEFVIPGRPVDVLVFDDKIRRRSDSIACHIWQTPLPKKAFFKTRGVYVSSPEFTFLQMASKLSIEQLIAFGCELCGSYRLLPKDARGTLVLDDTLSRLNPLTTTSAIEAFLKGAKRARGRGKAMRAIKYVANGSRSPMETMVYMLLCLPVVLGGYGLPKPEMNASIQLDEAARVVAHRSHCEGDLCWSDAQLDIEYHGDVHVGATQMKSDVGRELGIEHMGWRVITITSPQVFDPNQFEVIAKEAAARIGKRLRKNAFDAVYQRNALRHELAQWMYQTNAG